MAAFDPATLPTNIDTVEQLAFWALDVLAVLNPSAVTTEGTTSVPRLATATDEGAKNRIFRANLPLIDAFRESPGPLWTKAKELAATAIPEAFLEPVA